MTKKHFPQAADQEDSRIPEASQPLVQPWKAWWPPKSFTDDNVHQGHQGLENDPWHSWTFDNSRRFEKPWLDWPLKWPPTYNNLTEAPVSVHDAEAIQVTLLKQGVDPRLDEGVPRTTSFLQFFAADGSRSSSEKPYVSKIPPPKQGQSQINFGGCYHQVVLTDIAGYEDKFSLDVDGFKFVPGAYDNVNASLPEAYMDSITRWLKSYLGCTEVFAFDCVTRHENKTELGLRNCSDVARRVHCDQTPRSAIGRIKLHMGDRAETLLKGRCRLINVWRPLVPLVETYPLAACSFTTVSPSDLVPVDIVYPHFGEESFEFLPSPRHRWYFRSQMTSRDIALLKVFDNSKDESVAYLAPHSGFRDPRSQSTLPRSSIEVRCLVFGERQASASLEG